MKCSYPLLAMMAVLCLAILTACTPKASSSAQPDGAEYELHAIGFYNLENLFHPSNEPGKMDEEFTPDGRNRYTYERYQTKLTNLSKVLSEMANDQCPEGLAFIGVCEIENRQVLQDLVKEPALRKRNYQIVQYEGPDRRGIDVALLYNPRWFTYESSEPVYLDIVRDGDTTYTRDILHVTGRLNGERIHVLVNHWPSRSGGEKRSMYKRAAAASACRSVYDRLRADDPDVKVVIMGDLNDNPNSPSIASTLNAEGDREELTTDQLFNPMMAPFKRGIGSNAWRDTWSLFDQIIISQSFFDCDRGEHCFREAHVYNPKYLIQSEGRYAGYPHRTYSSGQFIGGYSDHFPVYAYLAKKQ